ncbi:family 16 glycoside hydrolase [Dyadobacter tibetensis]|uniref:family 16 glycoside hydrolase n=1 Tax=Dyadobacter tibetensis TaxID=1211851 RepID=UPI000471E639|nr:family 16 glycoside hydrolase [Dyadobacter tibetensis]
MHSIFKNLSCLLLAGPLVALGQGERYIPLNLTDLGAFQQAPANWSIKQDMSVLPKNGAKVKLINGSGTLIGSPGKALNTKLQASDLSLEFEFMLSPGAQGTLTLPGGATILLSDSYLQNQIAATTIGFSSIFPTQNAAKAPGLWQKLELTYDANLDNLPNTSRINTLKINGVMVSEAVYIPHKTEDETGPIGFEVHTGTIAFRNMGYQLLVDKQTLSLLELSYQVYGDNWDSPSREKLEKEGKTQILTQEVASGLKNFHLNYSGKMQVTDAGEYTFSSRYNGPAFRLEIDGKPVINSQASSSQDVVTGTVDLSTGMHDFKLYYARFPWRGPALGLEVRKAGIRSYPLTALSSLPQPAPKPYMEVNPGERPEMIRSFILLPEEKAKRTKCISVGGPQGWNYSIDLDRGALLQAWKGPFANVTEMWYERGEPQLLEPAGMKVLLSGKSSVANLKDDNSVWPDSSDIRFLGYHLDASGNPRFRYSVAGHPVTDQIISRGDGLFRTITSSTTRSNPLYVLLAQSKNIIEVEKGLYQIDGQYYIEIKKPIKPVIRKNMDGQELIIPLVGDASYKIFW